MFAYKEGFALATAALLFMAGSTAVAQANGGAMVSVNNQSAHDVEVVAEQENGGQIELGLVRGRSGEMFALPGALQDGTTEFRIRLTCKIPPPPGSYLEQYHEAVKTRLMTSKPGDEIVVTVADPLSETTVSRSSGSDR